MENDMPNSYINKLISKKIAVGLLLTAGVIFLLNNYGLFVSIPLPVPDTIALRANEYNKLLSEMDRLELDGSIIIAKGSYKIVTKQFNNVMVEFSKDTIVDAHFIAEVNKKSSTEKQVKIKVEFKEFDINFSAPISISGAGIEIAKLHSLKSTEKIVGNFSFHLANIIGYGLTNYILQKEQIPGKNGTNALREIIKSVSINKLTGQFDSGSELSTPSGVIVNESDLVITFFDVKIDEANGATGNIKMVTNSIIPPPFEVDGNKINFSSMNINYSGSFKYTKNGIELSSKKEGLSITSKKLTIKSPHDKNMNLLSVLILGNKSRIFINGSSDISSFELSGDIRARQVEYEHKSTKLALDLFVKDGLNLSFNLNKTKDDSSYTIASNSDIDITIRDFIFRGNAGLSFEYATINLPVFSVSSLKDVNVSIDNINIKTSELKVGASNDKWISILPNEALHIKFNTPLIINPFKTDAQTAVLFDIVGKSKKVTIVNANGSRLDFGGVEIMATSDGRNLSGQLSLSATGTKFGEAALSEIINESSINIDKMNFRYDGNMFEINSFPIQINIPESLVLNMVRKEISKPIKPSYGKIPGRNFGQILSLGIIKDYRSKTQVYGIKLNNAVFNGNTAKINLAGSVRVELEANVLKTRTKTCWTNGFEPCMKNGWTKTPLGNVKYEYPSTCSKKWKTDCPETYHDWINAASATIKADVAGRIDLDLPKHQRITDVVLKPKAKVLSVDIKNVPGWLDKDFLTPMVYMFIPSQELGKIKLFKSIPENTKKILDNFVVKDMSITSSGGFIRLKAELSGKL